MELTETPKLFREKCRDEEWTQSTSGSCPGHVQANLVIVPKELAFDFLLFCNRNPKPCPILEVTDAGDPVLKEIAVGADLRTDLPAYRVFRNGKLVEERTDISDLWRDDLVGFLIGCSYTFDAVLHRNGLPVAHYVSKRNPGIYTSNIPCKAAGIFHGPMVVTARPMPGALVTKAVVITSKFGRTHGAPVHVGDGAAIGIPDLTAAEYGGEGFTPAKGEVVLFWACGITPQAVAIASNAPFMITHKPGHMFVSDMTIDEIMAD
jgi:uncharacterized protein YcsI (UPF0317 family)